MEKLIDDLNEIFTKYKVSPDDVKIVQDDFAAIEGGGDIMGGDESESADFVPPDQMEADE